jgi:hypothetical protein
MPPTAWTFSTTQRGSPSAVMKNRTPSSRAMSIHLRIRSSYAFDDFSTIALKPIGLSVIARIARSPSRSSRLCTKLIEIGWTMPMPPAADTAATSSRFEQGYIAPQMRGTSIPTWRVKIVETAVIPSSLADLDCRALR